MAEQSTTPTAPTDEPLTVDAMRPKHRCQPIARAVAMEEGRDWWIGELIEPVPEWPHETHCLHMKTPIKYVVFLCNSGDFEQLLVMSNVVTQLKNLQWLESMTEMAITRAGNDPDHGFTAEEIAEFEKAEDRVDAWLQTKGVEIARAAAIKAAASGPRTAPDDAKPVGDLHLSVCDAVALLNQVVHKQEESRQAHDILRQALVDYTDSARPAQPSAPEPSSDARKVAREIVRRWAEVQDARSLTIKDGELIDAITTALTSTRSLLLKQIREAVEAVPVFHSAVARNFGLIKRDDALAAIDRVAKTSQTEPTNQSETRAVDGEWQPPIDLTKHFAKHPHVSLVDGVLGGVTPIVSKIRISVTHILGYLYHGKSIPEIGKTYSLSEEAVRDAIAFAHDVYDEVIHGPDDDDE